MGDPFCICFCLRLFDYFKTSIYIPVAEAQASQVVLVGKNPPANGGATGATGSVPGSGRSPGVGGGNQLRCSCLEHSMDRGAWGVTTHGLQKS